VDPTFEIDDQTGAANAEENEAIERDEIEAMQR
jgi:hypothetical protein